MAWNLSRILRRARELSASDVHLVRGVAPAVRIGGDIHLFEGEPLDESTLREMVEETLTAKQRQTLEEQMQLCFSRFWEHVGRCRASVYFHAGCPEMALRLCESRIRSREELHLPQVIENFTRLPNGLVLLTGPTGTGKTTTLNYMIDTINRERRAKIVTIEDPVEFVHENVRSIIVQQEVQTDVSTFHKALIHVLRQDPDVIVVGEMRDLETVATAITAAETSHLVMATLHTPDVVQTIQRVYSVFPSEQQNNVRYQLSNAIQAIVAQNLLPRADGKGLMLATEVCIATPAVRRHIREGEPHLIFSEMQTGKKLSMNTMDMSLLALYQKGDITYDAAISHAKDLTLFKNRSVSSTASA